MSKQSFVFFRGLLLILTMALTACGGDNESIISSSGDRDRDDIADARQLSADCERQSGRSDHAR